MKALRIWLAEHWRVRVPLNLPELEALLVAVDEAWEGQRRPDPDLRRAAGRVQRARDRRAKAVERAAATA